MSPLDRLEWLAELLAVGPPDRALRVAVSLAYRLNARTQQLNPGINSICRDTRISRRGAFYAIEWLDAQGWILRSGRRGRGRTNEYEIIPVEKVQQRALFPEEKGAEPCILCTHEKVHAAAQKDARSCTSHEEQGREQGSGRARARATRLHDDWELPNEWRSWALNAGHLSPDAAALKFRDYWIAASGQKAAKHDWFATWRNWIRNDLDRHRPANGGRSFA